MPAVEIRPGVHWIGVNDRTTDLFEGYWPIKPDGVSYNSYLVNGDQKALIDLARGFKTDEFLDQVAAISDPAGLSYVVINHMEPDHTGVLRTLRRVAPGATILTTRKAQEMLRDFYQVDEGVRVVEDGEQVSLGSHTLQFVSTPFVHWPETMMTYETTQRVLFSGDGFGGYGALRGAVFDDEYEDLGFYEHEALRYYVNIIAIFSRSVLKAIERLQDLQVDAIAPSHGLIWRHDPGHIVDLYRKWAGYAAGPGEPGVTLLYGSMYGNTEEVMNAVAQGVTEAGLPVDIFDVARTHPSYVLPSLWVRQGVLVGAPTYEGTLFPPMAHVLDVVVRKRILNRHAAYFGSHGWAGGARREFEQFAEKLKWEVGEPFEFRGGPTGEDLVKAEAFGASFARQIVDGER